MNHWVRHNGRGSCGAHADHWGGAGHAQNKHSRQPKGDAAPSGRRPKGTSYVSFGRVSGQSYSSKCIRVQ